jgi:hypothetical protein
MTVTKLQAGIAAAVLVAGIAGLISQHRTITGLRETRASLQQQATKFAAEKAALTNAQSKASAESAELRAEIATLKAGSQNVTQKTDSQPALSSGNSASAVTPQLIAASAAVQQRKAELHRRYDPFFRQRGLTPAQADRFVELMIEQADARQDLQAAVQAVGMDGNNPGVEALRSKLYEPITQELRTLLGDDGYAAYHDYEKTSYYRAAFVNRMSTMFSSANAPLSAEQTEQLARIVAANDHPQKLKPTDTGSESRIDWDSVVVQANATLTPAQMTAIQAYANQQRSAKRTP